MASIRRSLPQAETDPAAGLDSRLSSIVDMHSEPCSLLAEHVATAAGDLLAQYNFIDHENQHLRHGYVPDRYDWDVGKGRHVKRIYSNGAVARHTTYQVVPAGAETSVPISYLAIQLAGSTEIEGRTVDALVLATEVSSTERRRKLGKPMVRYALTNPSFAEILAVTREDVAVPIYGIRLDRAADCAYVTIPTSDDPFGHDLVVTSRDAAKSSRESALAELRDVLEDNTNISPNLARLVMRGLSTEQELQRLERKPADLQTLGVVARINETLGDPDPQVEGILASLRTMPDSLASQRRVKVARHDYPAIIRMTKMAVSATETHVITELRLKDAESMGDQSVFPRLRVFTPSRKPLCFDGVEPGSEQHRQLVHEFELLLGDLIKANTTS